MKWRIILLIFLFSGTVLSAQTEKVQSMYAETASGKVQLKELLQREFSDADSTSLKDLGMLFYQAGDFQSAGLCWEKALGMYRKHGKAYEYILNCLTAVYADSEDSQKTQWLMSVIDEHNEHELLSECNDYKCKLERAQYYIEKGYEEKAKAHILEALALCENEEQRAEVDEIYSQILFSIQDFEGAAQYGHSAAKRWKSLGNKEKYVNNLFYLIQNYLICAKYDFAEKYALEAAGLFENDFSEEGRLKYIGILSFLGDALFCQQKYTEALDAYEKEFMVCKDLFPDTEKHADALEDVGKVEVKLEKFDPAKKHLTQACEIYKTLNLESKYSNTYAEVIVCLRKSGDNSTANGMENTYEDTRKAEFHRLLDSELPNLPLTEKYLDRTTYTNSLNTIAGSYYGLDQYETSAHYFAMYSESLRELLQEKFLLLSETDRKRVWSEQQNNIDDFRFHVAVLPDSVTPLMPLFIPTLYDLELISKGIMLNSVIEFEKVLTKNGDKELLDIYRQVQKNQVKIEELQKIPLEENLQKTLALKQENTSLNQTLMARCAAFSDYTKYLSYNWHDVQKSLGKDDIAIEFTTVPLTFSDEHNYILALILTATGEPVMEVISTKQVIKYFEKQKDLYDNPRYYESFWGLIGNYLYGKKRVFFSPDNNLSNIAIEYLNDGTQSFFEKYEVYRLSSTKEICRTYSEKNPDKTITIFGDINYDKAHKAADQRSTYGQLLYGKEEINGIKSCMKKKYDVNIYSRNKATEEQFRMLSESSPMILHISSHGDYLGDSKISEEDAMKKSILLLTGANVWTEDTSNDGIITAEDVAQMNLQQCDLAVLSACNTGLGAQGADGIFGLQRGFKNAGVHTILMSLKPVYDESTAKLMVSFYNGIVNGKSKRQSLLDAQNTIKAIGYTDSKYWAPFILLDAF